MNNIQMRQTGKGFTLIELLVVIAIIGVLTALLFPAIKQALAKGQAISVGSDGKQVWTGLYATNLDFEQVGRATIWPADGTYMDSTDFFRDCITSNWLDSTFTFRYMAAPGLTAAAASAGVASFTAANNAWCVVLGTGAQTKLETPFMFTRNLISSTGGSLLTDVDALDPNIKPFGDTIAVVVSYGGAIRIIQGRDVQANLQELFNPMGEDLAFVTP